MKIWSRVFFPFVVCRNRYSRSGNLISSVYKCTWWKVKDQENMSNASSQCPPSCNDRFSRVFSAKKLPVETFAPEWISQIKILLILLYFFFLEFHLQSLQDACLVLTWNSFLIIFQMLCSVLQINKYMILWSFFQDWRDFDSLNISLPRCSSIFPSNLPLFLSKMHLVIRKCNT